MAKKISTISDDGIISILKKMESERLQAIELYTKNNRLDVAQNENNELLIIQQYIPKVSDVLNEEDTALAIDNVMADLGTTSKKEKKRIMTEIKTKYGNTVDMSIVNTVLSSKLT